MAHRDKPTKGSRVATHKATGKTTSTGVAKKSTGKARKSGSMNNTSKKG